MDINVIIRSVAVVIYLVIDTIYVFLSKNAYDSATKKIQNRPMIGRISGALLAYLCMAVGWFVLVAPQVEFYSKKYNPYLVGLIFGISYGLAVYGTFNFTMNAMFDQWSGKILMRDLAWGLTFPTIFTILYAIFYVKYK